MANQVFANSREVACKAADGKSICAFPDVCLSPPSPPAGPVPIPYPNTGKASDTSGGSKQVKVSGQEVMLKDKSFFKTSTGDEAATKSLGMGVVTHQIQGKVYFAAWSMDVKFEGENAVRHLDLMTHNHASMPGNTATWPYLSKSAVGGATGPCASNIKKEKAKCKDYDPHTKGKDICKHFGGKKPDQKLDRKHAKPLADALADRAAIDECMSARKCSLQPYHPTKCCPPQTPHHLVEASSFVEGRGNKAAKGMKHLDTFPNHPMSYDPDKAPCVCAEGTSHSKGGTHELMHTFQSSVAVKCVPKKEFPLKGGGKTKPTFATTYGAAKKSGITAFRKVFSSGACAAACLEAQLDAYHRKCGIKDSTECKAIATRIEGVEEWKLQATREVAERKLTVAIARAGKDTTFGAPGTSV